MSFVLWWPTPGAGCGWLGWLPTLATIRNPITVSREACGIRTVIPPKHGRPTTKPATGYYRRLMQTRFDRKAYRDRVQVETVMSMIKRRQGSHAPAQLPQSVPRSLLDGPDPQHHDSAIPAGFLQSLRYWFPEAELCETAPDDGEESPDVPAAQRP